MILIILTRFCSIVCSTLMQSTVHLEMIQNYLVKNTFETLKAAFVLISIALFLVLNMLCHLRLIFNFDNSLVVRLKEYWTVRLVH